MGDNPQDSLENTINSMGYTQIVPWELRNRIFQTYPQQICEVLSLYSTLQSYPVASLYSTQQATSNAQGEDGGHQHITGHLGILRAGFWGSHSHTCETCEGS